MNASRILINVDNPPMILEGYASDVLIATGQFTTALRIVQLLLELLPQRRDVDIFILIIYDSIRYVKRR